VLRKMAAAATSLRPIFKWAGGPGRSIDEGHKPNGPDDHVHAVEKKKRGNVPVAHSQIFSSPVFEFVQTIRVVGFIS